MLNRDFERMAADWLSSTRRAALQPSDTPELIAAHAVAHNRWMAAYIAAGPNNSTPELTAADDELTIAFDARYGPKQRARLVKLLVQPFI